VPAIRLGHRCPHTVSGRGGLSFLYLVAMLATGVRRRRLGDLAATTGSGLDMTGNWLPTRQQRRLALAPVVLLVLVVSGCHAKGSTLRKTVSATHPTVAVTAGGTKTYLAHGVLFDYPAGWQQSSKPGVRVTGGGGDKLWTAAVGAGDLDLVIVQAFRLRVPVTAENLDAVAAEVQALVQRLLKQLGGAVQAGPEKLMVGGLPGLRFRGTGTVDATPVESTLVFAFDHTVEYFLNCQHTQAKAAEVQRGCDQIVRSFRVATKLAFVSNRTGIFNVYLVNADGSGLQQLTRFRAGDLGRPSLSPDGEAVVFDRSKKPTAQSDIWVVRTDGRGLRNLTPDPEDDTTPAWSPDGTKIAFASSRSGAYDIFVMNPDGSAIEQLTDRGASDAEPAFSPDGTKLAFVECDTSFANCQLWTMNADGTGARRLTKTPVEDERPTWSPDGTRIAFTRTQGGNTDVYVITVASRREQRLTSGPADDLQPSWSPDGTRIAFSSNRAGPPSLYVMQADGTRVVRLTTPAKGQDEVPSWQP
jgi:Tol biopolymer transport system component